MSAVASVKRWIADVFRRNAFKDTTPLEGTLTPKEKDALWNHARSAVKQSDISLGSAIPPLSAPQAPETSQQVENEVGLLASLGKRAEHRATQPSRSKYPVLTHQMIDSGGKAVTTSQAIKLFKDFMLHIGYLDKEEVDEHATYFADEMKNEASNLSEEVEYQKTCSSDAIRETKRELASLRLELIKAKTEDQRADLSRQIDDTEAELADEMRNILKAVTALKSFREDKRQFLVTYVNRQTGSTTK